MNSENYTVTQYSISTILGFIQGDLIAIPDIQRPFVWQKKQVRDLIDSLYNGYPAGYLIIWQSPDARIKGSGSALGKKILIDGQQRVTALMAALLGYEVIDDNYRKGRIKIAFNPIAETEEERFAVQDSSHLKSRNWIPDIAEVFKPQFSAYSFVNRYLQDNPEVDPDKLNATITRLKEIANKQIGVIELNSALDIDQITEIFIRINSKGKQLNQADFAMSRIAADEINGGRLLRKAIDYFCHLATEPSFIKEIEANDQEFCESDYLKIIRWQEKETDNTYDPEYSDVLRVSFMSEFKRGKLADLVNLIAGRDFVQKTYKEEIALDSFHRLGNSFKEFANEYNFKQFLLTIKSAGFISEKLINSKITLDFAYTLFLLLNKTDIPKPQIKRYVQKWYVLTTLTSRYISSPESFMDRDIRGIDDKGFPRFFEEVEAAELSDSFWSIGLPQNLETSAINSPWFNVFLASQIYFNDMAFLSTSTRICDLITIMGDIHHVFPKGYLVESGIQERSKYNQVANYVYLDTQANIAIGKNAPKDYIQRVLEQCETGIPIIGQITNRKDLEANFESNCIPNNLITMEAKDYEDFLAVRRGLMAKKIKRFYEAL